MPSTRKQKAKEKRSRQSDVMSDIENLDVMLGAYSRNDLVEDENNTEPEVDLESGRLQRSEGQTENNFRSLLNLKRPLSKLSKMSRLKFLPKRKSNNTITIDILKPLTSSI